jgi:flagellar motor switch protein FliN/FliY
MMDERDETREEPQGGAPEAPQGDVNAGAGGEVPPQGEADAPGGEAPEAQEAAGDQAAEESSSGTEPSESPGEGALGVDPLSDPDAAIPVPPVDEAPQGQTEGAEPGAEGGGEEASGQPEAVIQPVRFPQFEAEETRPGNVGLDLLMDVRLPVTVRLGSTEMEIAEILDLGPGSVVALDKMAGEPVDLLVNGVKIGAGEVVVVDDHFGVRITHLASPRERLRKIA